MIKLVDFRQGETSCQHCGTSIKNLYIIDNDGIQMTVGSECVKTLLGTDTLPQEFKNAEKECKNAKFNESIVEMFESVHHGFKNSNIGQSLINGKRKAIDKAVLSEILKRKTYAPILDDKFTTNVIYWVNKPSTSIQERSKTSEEYIKDLKDLELKHTVKYINDFATTKECQTFLNKLVEYAEENFKVWGWTVKYDIGGHDGN